MNDVATEVFTVEGATRLVAFAKSKGLAWLSMRSAARDSSRAFAALGWPEMIMEWPRR
ncbi:hypothetical protein [Streptomyces sp. DSM 15324]|uniref:hypothetical protein n=1 Tax=Streptomyces sp. DSM 15324 TaxID=1739111 RepID=UPI003B63D18E